MHAVFRADASPAIGGGHVMRCLTLAGALTEAGWTCAFAARPGTVDAVPALARWGNEVVTLEGGADDEPGAMKRLWPEGADWLIVDHYGLDAAFEAACRPWARKVMVIDDLADRPHDCEVLLDQNLGRGNADYSALVPKGCGMLLGPHFALLRSQFGAARSSALERRANGGELSRIMVSMGATDPNGVTVKVLEGIGFSGVGAAIDVVVPADARGDVEKAAHGLPLRVHSDVADMAALMSRADLAVGGAGSTSWERCCLGLPSLLIVTADNQRAIADELESAGAARVLGWHGDVDPGRISRALADISADGDGRRRMGEAAARLCDGQGSHRIRERLS